MRAFHILESVVIIEQTVRKKLKARGQQQLPSSQFTWNKIFFRSCQADNLKRLDLETYLSLESAVSKQMYRFLDKRFYSRREWTFDLREFAFGHIGLSQNYTAAKIKEKLQPAIDELETIGFIEQDGPRGALREGRPRRVEDHAHAAETRPRRPRRNETSPPETQRARASPHRPRRHASRPPPELARSHPAEHIRERLEMFDWLSGKKDKRVSKSPGGYLAESIRKSYVAAQGLRVEGRPGEETSRRAGAEAERPRRRSDGPRPRRGPARRRSRPASSAYLDSLSPEEQEAAPGRGPREGEPVFRAAVSAEQRRREGSKPDTSSSSSRRT